MGTAEGKTQTDLNVESDRLRNGIYNQILLETAKTDLMIQCNAKMNSAAITWAFSHWWHKGSHCHVLSMQMKLEGSGANQFQIFPNLVNYTVGQNKEGRKHLR